MYIKLVLPNSDPKENLKYVPYAFNRIILNEGDLHVIF